jgi:hypothetical protein
MIRALHQRLCRHDYQTERDATGLVLRCSRCGKATPYGLTDQGLADRLRERLATARAEMVAEAERRDADRQLAEWRRGQGGTVIPMRRR